MASQYAARVAASAVMMRGKPMLRPVLHLLRVSLDDQQGAAAIVVQNVANTRGNWATTGKYMWGLVEMTLDLVPAKHFAAGQACGTNNHQSVVRHACEPCDRLLATTLKNVSK